MPRSVSRQQTPQSPPKRRAATAEPLQTRRSTRVKAGDVHDKDTETRLKKPTQPKLKPLVEQDDTIDVAASHDAPSNASDDEVDQASTASPQIGKSASAGLLDLEDWDEDDMIDNLPVLNEVANNVFELMQSRRASLQTHGHGDVELRLHARIQKQLAQLEANSLGYGLRYNLLQIGQALRFLQRNNTRHAASTAAYRGLAAILMKANLARFIAILISGGDLVHNKSARELLVHLCDIDVFPRPFVVISLPTDTHIERIDTTLVGATRDMGIDVLTQRLVAGALFAKKGRKTVDPTNLLKSVFLPSHESPPDFICGAATGHEDVSVTELVEQRMKEISHTFTTDPKQPIDMNALHRAFPWSDFVDTASTWANSRVAELDHVIAAAGGTKTIRNSFRGRSTLVETRAGQFDTLEPRRTVAQPVHAQNALARPVPHGQWADVSRDLPTDFLEGEELSPDEEAARAAARVMGSDHNSDNDANEDENAVRDHPSAAERTIRQTELVTQRVVESESPSAEIKPTISSPTGHGPSQAHEQADEEPGFYDASRDDQGMAQRNDESDRDPSPELDGGEGALVFHELQMQNLEARKENLPPHGKSKSLGTPTPSNPKRARDSEEDRSEFEQDVRSPQRKRMHQGQNVVARRRGMESGQQESRLAGPSREEFQRREAPSPPIQRAGAESRLRALDEVEEENEEELPPMSTAENYERVRRHMAELAPLARSGQVLSHRQVRRPWSRDEIGRLLDLMAICGPAWTNILKHDARLEPACLQERTNVQLKDKARNMKFDFLKAMQPLPEGFSHVTLSLHQKKQLDGMRIPYS